MKIYIKNGRITAEAESFADEKRLLLLRHPGHPEAEQNKAKKGTKYRKECELCGKKFKRLGLHMRLKHPVKELAVNRLGYVGSEAYSAGA